MKGRSGIRALRTGLAAVAVLAAACGETPAATEEARGVLEGLNVVLALTIVFLLTVGVLVVGAIGLDRFIRTRRELEAAPPELVEEEEEEEEAEEVVAGIRVGQAAVPRWLYAFYVLIPLFAFMYVLNTAAFAPPQPEAVETPTPEPVGPVTEAPLVASGILFDRDVLMFPADTEVTVIFENQDAGVPHDFTVWPDEATAQTGDAGQAIYKGDIFSGVQTSEEVFTTPGPGEYYFNCTVHPASMVGTVEVVEG